MTQRSTAESSFTPGTTDPEGGPLTEFAAYHWTARGLGALLWLGGNAGAVWAVVMLVKIGSGYGGVPGSWVAVLLGSLLAAWMIGTPLTMAKIRIFPDAVEWGYWFKDRLVWDEITHMKITSQEVEGVTIVEAALWTVGGAKKVIRGGSSPSLSFFNRLRMDFPAGPPPRE